jgi:hypothetical protein
MSRLHPDFTLQNEGSIILLHPGTEPAVRWVENNIGEDNGFQPFLPTVVVEHRFIGQIVDGIQLDGLSVAEVGAHEAD